MVEVIGKNVYRTKIGYYDYIIKVVPKDNENLVMDDGEIHSGVTDFITKVIYIRDDLLNDSLEYTIRHEITHAFIEAYGFLQVEWNDEIVSDFMAIYGEDIGVIAKEVLDAINRYFEYKASKEMTDALIDSAEIVEKKLKGIQLC